jgi:hypothetical protein
MAFIFVKSLCASRGRPSLLMSLPDAGMAAPRIFVPGRVPSGRFGYTTRPPFGQLDLASPRPLGSRTVIVLAICRN